MESLSFVPYSVRRRRELESFDHKPVLEYDSAPGQFLGQACFCLVDAIGYYQPFRDGDISRYWNWKGQPLSNDIWFKCDEQAERELGIYSDWSGDFDPQSSFLKRLQNARSLEWALDLIEIGFYNAHHMSLDPSFDQLDLTSGHQGNPLAAASNLNKRFAQHNLGYRINIMDLRVEIVRIDSEFLLSEVVLPALDGLNQQGFEGALLEFRDALSLLYEGKLKASMNECLKSFESTMKIICFNNGWYVKKATAFHLVGTLQKNGIFEESLSNYTNQLVSILQSAVPNLRNDKSAHGQGHQVVEITEPLAHFVLNLTASNIVFLLSTVNSRDSKIVREH